MVFQAAGLILGTVCMQQHHFQLGIDPILLCLKYFAATRLCLTSDPNFPQQVLWTHAQKIANLFPENEREQYQAAAVTMRLPYWDWAIHPALPDVVTEPSIIVSTPTGRRRIKNPMFEYVFQSNATGNGFPSSHPVCASYND